MVPYIGTTLPFPPNPSHLPLLSIPTSPALGFLGKRRKLCFFLSLTSQCRQHMAQNCEAICSESGCILSSNSIKCFIWSFYGCNSLGTAQGERPGSSHLQCKPSSISLNGFSFVQQKSGNNLHLPLHTHAWLIVIQSPLQFFELCLCKEARNRRICSPLDKLNQFPYYGLVLMHCHLVWKINITKPNQKKKKRFSNMVDEMLSASTKCFEPI